MRLVRAPERKKKKEEKRTDMGWASIGRQAGRQAGNGGSRQEVLEFQNGS